MPEFNGNGSEVFPPDFRASDRIIKIWRRGIVSYQPWFFRPLGFFILRKPGSTGELRKELSNLVFSTMIAHFQWSRGTTAKVLPLFGSDSVFNELKGQLLNTILVKDKDVLEMLELMEVELQAYLRQREPIIASTWGRAGLVEGKLVIELNAKERLNLPRATSRTLDIAL